MSKFLLILSLVSGLMTGCSSKQTRPSEERNPASYRVSQNFWTGGTPTEELCSSGKGGNQDPATPLGALLSIVTLGIYSPLDEERRAKRAPRFCP